MRALVIAGGDPGPSEWLAAQIAGADLVIAADSGAAAALRSGVPPHVVVGDFDSLAPGIREELRERGTELIAVPAEKDQTDTELAVLIACERGAAEVVIVGALRGPRLDHELACVFLLAIPELRGRSARIVDPAHELFLLTGPERRSLEGSPGDYVTLLPVSAEAPGIRTEGLRYPLNREALEIGRSRGVSNELIGTNAAVSLESGLLLVVHHRLGGEPAVPEAQPPA